MNTCVLCGRELRASPWWNLLDLLVPPPPMCRAADGEACIELAVEHVAEYLRER